MDFASFSWLDIEKTRGDKSKINKTRRRNNLGDGKEDEDEDGDDEG